MDYALCDLSNWRLLFSEYDKIVKTQLESKTIESVPQEEWEFKEAHFLPHHGIIREDKETFDGSAKAEKCIIYLMIRKVLI